MINEYSEAVSEALEVLKYLEDELLNKIPLNVIKKLKEQSLTSYTNKFEDEVDPSKLSDKAKNVIAVLYRDYIANEEEKVEFDKLLHENELKQVNQEYTIKRFEKQEKQVSEFLPVVAKKSFMQKIFEKIFKTNKNS